MLSLGLWAEAPIVLGRFLYQRYVGFFGHVGGTGFLTHAELTHNYVGEFEQAWSCLHIETNDAFAGSKDCVSMLYP